MISFLDDYGTLPKHYGHLALERSLGQTEVEEMLVLVDQRHALGKRAARDDRICNSSGADAQLVAWLERRRAGVVSCPQLDGLGDFDRSKAGFRRVAIDLGALDALWNHPVMLLAM